MDLFCRQTFFNILAYKGKLYFKLYIKYKQYRELLEETIWSIQMIWDKKSIVCKKQ